MAEIMMDIETLGTNHDCVVIQVSMVKFKWDKTITDELTVNLNIQEQLEAKRTVDASTMDWWKDQNPEIFKQCTTNPLPVHEALKRIQNFIDFDDNIWSHATFDVPIIISLFKSFKTKFKWKYKNARDIRTLIAISEINLNDYDWSAKTHNSLDDSKFQVEYCCDAFNSVKKWKNVYLGTNLSVSKEELEEKIKTLKNEYMAIGGEKTKSFLAQEKSPDEAKRFVELHDRQNEIIKELTVLQGWLKSKLEKIPN